MSADERGDSSDSDDSQEADLWTGGATTEAATERDGFASYSAEVHAIGHGVYDGLRTRRLRANGTLPDHPDVQAEPHYYKAAFVIGTILQLVMLLAASGTGWVLIGG